MKLRTRIARIIPHATMILAGMFIVFWILDIINPVMDFTGRSLSKKLLLILLVLTIVTAVMNVYYERKSDRLENGSGPEDDGREP